MHSANFTAFSTLAAVLPPPLLPEPVAAGAFEPHALIRATMAIRARAASGRSFLLMASPRSPRAPMIAAMTTAIARRIVDRVRLLAVLVRCRSRLQSRQRDVVSTYVFFDMPTIFSGLVGHDWAARHADRLRLVSFLPEHQADQRYVDALGVPPGPEDKQPPTASSEPVFISANPGRPSRGVGVD